MSQTQNPYAMQDPIKQYPQPKFKKQPQSAPGLAQDMDPKPDHGENSYKGFSGLAGRRAVITGADSGIGCAVAIAFAREGTDVVLNDLLSEEAGRAGSRRSRGGRKPRRWRCPAISARRASAPR